MKIELLIISITIFFIANTYYDGKYVQILKSWKKYYQMAGIAFAGISAYAYLKKYPNQTQSLVSHANGFIKHMPIDKEAGDLLSPLLNLSNNGLLSKQGTQTPGMQTPGMQTPGMQMPGMQMPGMQMPGMQTPQQKRMMNSGTQSTKRSVSETKKKYVAAQQNWTCKKCKQQLPAWFEVDHIKRLEYGGTNHVNNLEALCRDCHGRKTAMENL
mgnify:CR=1 FL=1|tara:strand:- start:509 stop:1147 length:639 start_codon:yes stop_codon:yes gene_type:complete